MSRATSDRAPALDARGIAAAVGVLAAGAALWLALDRALGPLAGWLAGAVLGLDPASRLGGAVGFFLYEAPKVLLLLVLVVFGMTLLRSFFPPEVARRALAGRRARLGNVLGAGLGVVTPFCSCSAVSLFIGFLSAGVPLGVTMSFLVAAPMVNEVALALLFGLFGWKVAGLYLGMGLAVAVAAGWALGRLGMERYVEDWVRAARAGADAELPPMTWPERLDMARAGVKDIVGRTWPFVVGGIAVGAGIHGYVPTDFMSALMGRGAWWSVPLAVVAGVPMYANAAGTLPVVHALIGKGAALGTALAFMMSVVALSLPEFVILRRVLKLPLLAAFAGVVTLGIVIVGYAFNALLG